MERRHSRIGFVGLGTMGAPMAANLARAGFPLVVRDADAACARAFARTHGATTADGPDAFAHVEALVTMLPTGVIVREALIDDGIAAALPGGALVLDTSSSPPAATRSLGLALAEHGVALVDAPVSGGVAKAIDGTLSIMLGADDEEAAARAVPLLEAMSERILRTGRLGSGHAMKALNNVVSATGFVAAAEALVVGGGLGVDPAVLLEVLNASSGRNFNTETTLVTEVLPRRFDARFTLGLIAKDTGIAVDLAEATGAQAPVFARVHDRLAEAALELGPQTDYSAAIRLWERRAGVELPVRRSRAR